MERKREPKKLTELQKWQRMTDKWLKEFNTLLNDKNGDHYTTKLKYIKLLVQFDKLWIEKFIDWPKTENMENDIINMHDNFENVIHNLKVIDYCDIEFLSDAVYKFKRKLTKN